MAKVKLLLSHFQASFEDRILTSSERKDLVRLLSENHLKRSERDFLISQLYEMAEQALGQGKNEEIMEWLKRAVKMVQKGAPQPGEAPEVYFSPGPHCLSAILHEINDTRKRLDVCVFTISDDRISDVLIRRHKLGLPIRIITDNEKLYDAGSDIERMAKAGIPIKVDNTPNHMHHKFALFDKDTALTGSYNWTRSAARYNFENIVITRSPVVVNKFRKHFDKIWEEMDAF